MIKNAVLSLILLLAFTGISFAQAPEAINYQAVARNGSGLLLGNQNLTLRVGIYSGSGGATKVYEETHTITTNQFGLFSIKIGKGTVTSGTFSTIGWESAEHHLQVEADDGSGYVNLGMNQFITVPYALHAKTALKVTNMALNELSDVSTISPNSNDVLAWTGAAWAPKTIASSPWTIAGNNIYYPNGYVGIGTTTPTVGLDIESAAGYGSAVALKNTGGGLEWRLTSWTDGTFRLVKTSGTTFSAMVIEPTDGHIGIGTATPDQPLHVHTNSGISYIRVSDNTSGPTSGLRMGLSGSGNAYIINDMAAKSLSLGTDGTTRMRILDGGNVGINVTSPAQILHIRQNAANKGLRIQHQSTTDYWENGTGTTTKNYKFYYNNLFRADISATDGAYTQSSDRRLKKDIVYMGSVLNKITQLKPATYHYIDNSKDAPRSTGFVAQEVEPIFPNLVRDTDEGFKGLVYDGFAVISIKAIQELNEKMEGMQKELDELKALKKEVAELKALIQQK
ncbi:MAG: tail fiber domain-containing protein [Aureispira sp.]|nr:tail fiber domain-containing protein [Aureispira sp.]